MRTLIPIASALTVLVIVHMSDAGNRTEQIGGYTMAACRTEAKRITGDPRKPKTIGAMFVSPTGKAMAMCIDTVRT